MSRSPDANKLASRKVAASVAVSLAAVPRKIFVVVVPGGSCAPCGCGVTTSPVTLFGRTSAPCRKVLALRIRSAPPFT
jgi:hypothetical protein